jgi:hypothetical protein
MGKRKHVATPFPAPPQAPKPPVRTPITEVEGLKVRIAQLRGTINVLNRQLLEKDRFLCDLKEELTKFEDFRDIGNLSIRPGDQVMYDNDTGKYSIERVGAPMGAPPIPPPPGAPPSSPAAPNQVDSPKPGGDNGKGHDAGISAENGG